MFHISTMNSIYIHKHIFINVQTYGFSYLKKYSRLFSKTRLIQTWHTSRKSQSELWANKINPKLQARSGKIGLPDPKQNSSRLFARGSIKIGWKNAKSAETTVSVSVYRLCGHRFWHRRCSCDIRLRPQYTKTLTYIRYHLFAH